MTEKIKRTYTFGPVPSRRLGRSLGVDFVPFKTCTYDCIYCQLGRTTDKTAEGRAYYPAQTIIENVREKLRTIPRPDYITLSGSGEPTLHTGIKDIITGIQNITDIPVAVLTNGSLFWMEDVRDSVLEADLIMPSLDAGDEDTFVSVNRPHQTITFRLMVDGLVSLRRHYRGPIWLEVFLIKATADDERNVRALKELINRIEPERVQLNTAVRTTAEDFVEAVTQKRMKEIAELLGSHCEIIAEGAHVTTPGDYHITDDDILEMVRRRPCSIDDISAALNAHRHEVIKYAENLMARALIIRKRWGHKILYIADGNHKKIDIQKTDS